jgi:putative transposase
VIDAEDYLFACMRYIELNPVRAGMVAHPSDYRWSSYRAHAEGEGDGPAHRPQALPLPRHGCRIQPGRLSPDLSPELTEALLTEIREATNKGWALGGERFRREIEALGSRRASPGKVGRPANEAADQLTGDLSEMLPGARAMACVVTGSGA